MRAPSRLLPLLLIPGLLAVLPLAAQEAQKSRVQINVINVCTPGEAEVKQMQEAVTRIPARPRFTSDFEISRGRSSMQGSVSRWVRLRRDFGADSPFVTAQYTMSVQEDSITETLVLRLRDPRDVVQEIGRAHV